MTTIKASEAYGGECLKNMMKVWDQYDKSVGGLRLKRREAYGGECLKNMRQMRAEYDKGVRGP